MKQIVKDKNLIAYCGLYCGACGRYLNEKCPGCKENKKAAWCKVRKCCMENGKLSCADCDIHTSAADCKKFNNIFSKIFSFIFGSDRQASLNFIKERGYDVYAEEMVRRKSHTIKRNRVELK